MSDTHTYTVLREQDGDRTYRPGETRELTEADAAHLVGLGSLHKTTSTPKAAKQKPKGK